MKPRLIFKGTIILSILSISIIFSTCKKDVVLPTFNDQGLIGAQGGIIKTDDGASIEIPAGALSSAKTISITNITEGDTVINNGCRIYELGPEGLIFSDSIIITLPFDDTYLDLTSKEEDYGIGIMVFQDNKWIKLKSEISLGNKNVISKTTHFSIYVVYYPSKWSEYFYNNKDNPGKVLTVPFYGQGLLPWCGYYSLSMITKYAGYNYKAPFFATLFDTPPSEGINFFKIWKLVPKLKDLGIEAEAVYPPWSGVTNLAGYILKQLNEGRPVYVGSGKITHAFVVTGYNNKGFFINDPSGAFLSKIFNEPDLENLTMRHVSYEDFFKVIFPLPNDDGDMLSVTIISKRENSNNGTSLNFFNETFSIEFEDSEGINLGGFDIDGTYKPNGYLLLNYLTKNNSFDGTDWIYLNPILANSSIENDAPVIMDYKIDNEDIIDSPLSVTIPKLNSYYKTTERKLQLKDLKKGDHTLVINIRSKNVPSIIYDSWEFPFKIANELLTNRPPTDADGNTYKTVVIGTQTWMAENLKTTRYNDGTGIPLVTDNLAWISLTTPGYCWYNNNETIYKGTYGALYNWYTVNTGKLCPANWHVPTDAEWTTLIDYLGGTSGAGSMLKETGTNHWQSPNADANNQSGFTALPGGARRSDGTYNDNGTYGMWWSSSGITTASFWTMNYNHTEVYRHVNYKLYGYSVRCVRD